MLTQRTFFFIWPFFFRRPAGSGHIGLRSLSPAKTVGLAAARPLSPATSRAFHICVNGVSGGDVQGKIISFS